jgi:hypothetical protein
VFGLTVALGVGALALTASATPGNGNGGPPTDLPTPTVTPTPPIENPGSPGDDCSRGASDQECREDPNENGQDCLDHGVASGNEDHCLPVETPTETPTPDPTTTPTTPRVVCNPSVSFGPWYGDPRINITLTGPGVFEVKGGKQRFSGLHVVRVSLGCGQTQVVGRYKVLFGHSVRVYLNGTLFASQIAPSVKSL